jgi:hypothetical protein
LPDSFVAMIARAGGDVMWWERLAWVFCYMIPGLFFFGFLAERIARDAARIGLARRTRKIWVVWTVVFGLPAYIAYRVTRPKVTLVTCTNCGLGRRPDMEKCHHCGSAWVVPELVPPAWRVLGEPEQAEAASPSPADEVRRLISGVSSPKSQKLSQNGECHCEERSDEAISTCRVEDCFAALLRNYLTGV